MFLTRYKCVTRSILFFQCKYIVMPQWRQIFPDLSEYQPEVSKIRQENQINFNFISNSQISVLYCKRLEYVICLQMLRPIKRETLKNPPLKTNVIRHICKQEPIAIAVKLQISTNHYGAASFSWASQLFVLSVTQNFVNIGGQFFIKS